MSNRNAGDEKRRTQEIPQRRQGKFRPLPQIMGENVDFMGIEDDKRAHERVTFKNCFFTKLFMETRRSKVS